MRLLIIFCFISLAFFVGCESKRYEIYSTESLGLQLEIPSDWNIEETERVTSLTLTPTRGKNRDDVSISILLEDSNSERELAEVLESVVDRFKGKWSVDEITIIEPVEEGTLNDFQSVKVTIEAPVQKTNGSSSFQPMDILIVDTGDRIIGIYFWKSIINTTLNEEGQNIINSIKALDVDSFS